MQNVMAFKYAFEKVLSHWIHLVEERKSFFRRTKQFESIVEFKNRKKAVKML